MTPHHHPFAKTGRVPVPFRVYFHEMYVARTPLVPDARVRPVVLTNLAETESEGKALRDDIVDPLRKTIEVTGVTATNPTAWRSAVGTVNPADTVDSLTQSHLSGGLREVTTGLGVTGSALGGVIGVAQIVKGAREGKPKLLLSGAAEITMATATLAAIGLVPGAASLAPVGASLLGLRAINDVRDGKSGERIDGWRDLITAATVSASLLNAPVAMVAGLGTAALGFNTLRGLSRIKEGHEENNGFRSAQGTGALMSAMGIGLLTSGLAVAPGVGLIGVGLALPLLQQVRFSKNAVEGLTKKADKVLYPVALKAEKVELAIQELAKPLLDPVFEKTQQAWNSSFFSPIRKTGQVLEQNLSLVTTRVVDKLAQTALVRKLDAWIGRAKFENP